MVTITETNYNDIWCEIRQDLLLTLDITHFENDKMEYVIILDRETGAIKTVVHKRTDYHKSFLKSLKLAPEEMIIARIDKYTIPESLIYDKNYDEFTISCLKLSDMEGLYEKVIEKMPNGYDGDDFFFSYPSLDQMINLHYEDYCKRDFIEKKLADFVYKFLDNRLKELNITTKITA